MPEGGGITVAGVRDDQGNVDAPGPDLGHLPRFHTITTTPTAQQTRHSKLKLTKPY